VPPHTHNWFSRQDSPGDDPQPLFGQDSIQYPAYNAIVGGVGSSVGAATTAATEAAATTSQCLKNFLLNGKVFFSHSHIFKSNFCFFHWRNNRMNISMNFLGC
jgi:hypothetical protein